MESVDIVGDDYMPEVDESFDCECPKCNGKFTAVAKVSVKFCCTAPDTQ